jgi:hypothetical protein
MKITGSGLFARTAALTASSMRMESLCFSKYSWTDMLSVIADPRSSMYFLFVLLLFFFFFLFLLLLCFLLLLLLLLLSG